MGGEQRLRQAGVDAPGSSMATTVKLTPHTPPLTDRKQELNIKEITLSTSSTASTTFSLPSQPAHCLQSTTSSNGLLPTNDTHKSTYHIYHKRESHYLITPIADAYKDLANPSFRAIRQHAAAKKEQQKLQKLNGGVVDVDPGVEALSYFVHAPHVSFHRPPRTLRRGSSKDGPVVCLMHKSWRWKEWMMQLGGAVEEEGVMDPRGVVGEEFTQGHDKSNEKSLRGYRIRSWRLWGETGKAFHRDVNLQRRTPETETGIMGPEFNGDCHPNLQARDGCLHIEDALVDISLIGHRNIPAIPAPVKSPEADEALHLTWTAPFSRDPRRYHFHYGGIDFYWKGTKVVSKSKFSNFWPRYNHLKLVAQLSANESSAVEKSEPDCGGKREIVIARYTSSICGRKAGVLEVFDSALLPFIREPMPSLQPTAGTGSAAHDGEDTAHLSEPDQDGEERIIAALRRTRLYDLIISAAMCMIIGEAQKRDVIRKIVEFLLGEASGGGG